MSIATRLSKAGKLRRSGMLVESASHSNIQPLQCATASGRAGGNGTRFVAAIWLRSQTGSQRTLEQPCRRTLPITTFGLTRPGHVLGFGTKQTKLKAPLEITWFCVAMSRTQDDA